MVSKRRLPPANGNGKKDAIVPVFAQHDRVQRLGGVPKGIVCESKRGKVKVWWGTADNKPVTSWVPAIELELTTEPVVDGDTVIKRQTMGGGR